MRKNNRRAIRISCTHIDYGFKKEITLDKETLLFGATKASIAVAPIALFAFSIISSGMFSGEYVPAFKAASSGIGACETENELLKLFRLMLESQAGVENAKNSAAITMWNTMGSF